jgi:hypothetical protein
MSGSEIMGLRRQRYQADYDSPGMRSNSRSPPLVGPFPITSSCRSIPDHLLL